jgi:hypothetical protein
VNVQVVRRLATSHTLAELDAAVAEYERDRTNRLAAEGADEGEVMSHLLTAQFVRSRMDAGTDLNVALREYAQRVKTIFGKR